MKEAEEILQIIYSWRDDDKETRRVGHVIDDRDASQQLLSSRRLVDDE